MRRVSSSFRSRADSSFDELGRAKVLRFVRPPSIQTTALPSFANARGVVSVSPRRAPAFADLLVRASF